MFEVTIDDIMALDDKALRELVGRLCKAEIERDNGSTSGVYYGGDQDAKDGGVDVEVDIDFSLRKGSYIPRRCTYYQVKKPKMSPKVIEKEMCPNGERRLIFNELASRQGGYIIVSGKDNVTKSGREKRIDAMKKSLGALEKDIYVDFYDQSRLMDWANCYEPVVAWVKDTIGCSHEGWYPYGNWTGHQNEPILPYVVDKQVRIKKADKAECMHIEDALTDIRTILQTPGTSVRFTGLSGVGKTRFAQALFEEEIGHDPLSKEIALYVDRQGHPQIAPIEVVRGLIAKKHRMVVIVDNCSASEHHDLTKICSSLESTVSLLTIEYDVKKDVPEDSEVYQMCSASDECIVDILSQYGFNRNVEDYKRIALLAGGNARVAIVLAKATKKDKNLNELKDQELFRRIFLQKNEIDDGLYKTAEVCSLVYSFSMGSASEQINEIKILADLCEISAGQITRNINRLSGRQVVQKRSNWRAVLPHALANHLAKEALEDFGAGTILKAMEAGSYHMMRSFSKRLSYLHDNKEAQDIFRSWLEMPPMTTPNMLNYICQYRLEDAAAVVPEQILSYLEDCYNKKGKNYLLRAFQEDVLVNVLSQLAYEPRWFDRSLELLSGLPLMGKKKEIVGPFFQIAYSGTYATIEQRISFVKYLLHNSDNSYNKLGIDCLEIMLKCKCSIKYSYRRSASFGMLQRDAGLDLSKEYKQWYLSVIDFIGSEMPRLSRREQDKLKNILGDSLNGFGFERYLDIIEKCCIKFGSDREWWQGWIGLGGVKVHYKERFDRSEKEVLNRLIASVEPTDPVSRMICILQNSLYELQAYFSTEEMIKEECKKLTVSFIEQPDLLDQLFFKLKGTCLFWGAFFGEELAKTERQGTFAPLWPKICKALDDDLSIAKAYLNVKYKCDKKKTIVLLDSLEDTNNASQSVHLHFLLECSKDYLEHILKLLTDGIVDINCVSHLWYTVAGGKIEENDFLDFLLKIMDVDQGTSVVLNVFWSYYCDLKREGPLLKCAKEVGCEIIIKAVKKIEPKSAYDLNNKLEKLIDACFLSGDISKEEIEKLFSVLNYK